MAANIGLVEMDSILVGDKDTTAIVQWHNKAYQIRIFKRAKGQKTIGRELNEQQLKALMKKHCKYT